MITIVEKLATPKAIFFRFGAFLVLCALANTLLQQNYTYLTQTFHYTPEQAYSLLELIGKHGRTSHLLIFIVDLFMITLYCGFLIGANYYTFGFWVKNCAAISIITFSPLVLGFVQLGEISVLAFAIANFPNKIDQLFCLANFLTNIKYYLTPVCFAFPIIGLCVKMIIILHRKRARKSERKCL